jgi:Hint module
LTIDLRSVLCVSCLFRYSLVSTNLHTCETREKEREREKDQENMIRELVLAFLVVASFALVSADTGTLCGVANGGVHFFFSHSRCCYYYFSLVVCVCEDGNSTSSHDDDGDHHNNHGSCFPASATLLGEDGTNISMGSLRVGDRVLSVDAKGSLCYSTVYAFLDHKPSVRLDYVRLELVSGHTVSLSSRHRVFRQSSAAKATTPGGNPTHGEDVDATEVTVGDLLWVAEERAWHEVSAVGVHPQLGAYAPATMEGTLIVNQVMVSCYARVSHSAAHTALAPLRALSHLLSDATEQQDGVHWYPRLLLTIFGWWAQ